MGAPVQSLDVKNKMIVLENKEALLGGCVWNKVLAEQSITRRQVRKQRMKSPLRSRRPSRNICMVVRKVKTLKKLVPNGRSSSMSLDGLFRETADYILSLEMQLKVMQTMVNVLSASSNTN